MFRVVALLFLLLVFASGQTRLSSFQMGSKLKVLEWSPCDAPPVDKSDCTGLIWLRITWEDGRHENFILGPSTPEIDQAAKNWKRVPL